MKSSTCFVVFFALVATVLSNPEPFPSPSASPAPLPQNGSPLAAIGSFITRLQTNFAEGTASIGQPLPNVYSLPLSPSSTTTIPTTTRPPPPTTSRRPTVTSAFDSINAILDNISRSSSGSTNAGPNNNRIDNNNIFGSVPGRNLDLPPVTTPRPFFPITTTRSPFNLDGINQGINAFFQAFIKTNLDKIFRPGQQQDGLNSKRDIQRRNDQPTTRPLALHEIILNGLFKKQQ